VTGEHDGSGKYFRYINFLFLAFCYWFWAPG
jgi:hypothetical protein